MGPEITATVAIAAGAAWASGINLYAALLMFGILGTTGTLTLPPNLEILTNPLVITAAGFMYLVEFFADKTPGVDSAWDVIHTFVRIPAGAALAAGAVGELDAGVQMAAFIVGGGLAASSHVAKTSSRAVINTSPEPVTNWSASVTEDLMVFGGLWAALNHPVVFLVLLLIFLLALAWLLPKIFRILKGIFSRIRDFFRGTPPGTDAPPIPEAGQSLALDKPGSD